MRESDSEIQKSGAEMEMGMSARDRITALLHRTVGHSTSVANAEFRQFGFNVQGARVLICLLERGPTRVGELGAAVAIDNSTLSHLLRRLGQKALVVRYHPEDDNRSVIIALTEFGREVASKCRQAALDHEAILLKGFDAKEIARVRHYLKRICENAEDWSEMPNPLVNSQIGMNQTRS